MTLPVGWIECQLVRSADPICNPKIVYGFPVSQRVKNRPFKVTANFLFYTGSSF